MSNPKRITPPNNVLDELGADALRAYQLSPLFVQNFRFQRMEYEVIRSTVAIGQFSLFTQYANVDMDSRVVGWY